MVAASCFRSQTLPWAIWSTVSIKGGRRRVAIYSAHPRNVIGLALNGHHIPLRTKLFLLNVGDVCRHFDFLQSDSRRCELKPGAEMGCGSLTVDWRCCDLASYSRS